MIIFSCIVYRVKVLNRIVSLAQQQEIYYEVFPYSGSRIALNEDKAWMQEMIKGDTPPNHVRKVNGNQD